MFLKWILFIVSLNFGLRCCLSVRLKKAVACLRRAMSLPKVRWLYLINGRRLISRVVYGSIMVCRLLTGIMLVAWHGSSMLNLTMRMLW